MPRAPSHGKSGLLALPGPLALLGLLSILGAIALGVGCPSLEGPATPPLVPPSGDDDDDAAPWDEDGDGYGVLDGDCDDSDAAISPAATEVCDPDDVDEDCDGGADDADPEGASGAAELWPDVDGDGFGRDGASAVRCDPPGASVDRGGDCDDTDAASYPGAPRRCDLRDNDCDGLVQDEGLVTLVGSGATDSTIQGILDLAPVAATVHVCPGIHRERVVVERAVSLVGIGGRAATTIDGEGAGRPLTVLASSVLLHGLTFFDGAADEGGGLFIEAASNVTVSSCAVLAGVASLRGGGVAVRDASGVTISDLLVLDGRAPLGAGVAWTNSAGSLSDLIVRRGIGEEGAGVLVDGGSFALQDGVFGENAASVAGGGLSARSDAALVDVDLLDNTAPVGAGAHVGGGTLSLTDGAVWRNAGSAGAIHVVGSVVGSGVWFGEGGDANLPADVTAQGGASYVFGVGADFVCGGDGSGGDPGCH